MLKEEEEEIADEYRGLPYEERLQVLCFENVLLKWISVLDIVGSIANDIADVIFPPQLAVGDGIVNRTRGNAPNHGKSGQDADRSHEGADAMGEGQGPPCEQGAHPSRESGTEGGQHASEGVAPGTISGQVKTFSDVHVLRTGRCSGKPASVDAMELAGKWSSTYVKRNVRRCIFYAQCWLHRAAVLSCAVSR